MNDIGLRELVGEMREFYEAEADISDRVVYGWIKRFESILDAAGEVWEIPGWEMTRESDGCTYLCKEKPVARKGWVSSPLHRHPSTPAPSAGEGFVVVPRSMHVDASALDALSFVCGGPGMNDPADGDKWCDGTLWIGDLTQDDGSAIHGLHISCKECPEEGSITLSDFAAAPAAQVAEVAGLHPKTAGLVRRFSTALAEKLAAAEKKYGYRDGWSSSDWMDECRAKLLEHVAKGDPRDVAAYCAFLWHHGERTAAAPTVVVDEAMVERACLAYTEDRKRVQPIEPGIVAPARNAMRAALAAALNQGKANG